MSQSKPFNTTANGIIEHDHNHDGIDRRGFLRCMAWAGTGALCLVEGGVLKSYALGSHDHAAKAAVDKVNALATRPEFVLHTGDVSHLSKPEEFDNVQQILKSLNREVFFVPGEHDVLNDEGAAFLE